jgi:hypothetical protein
MCTRGSFASIQVSVRESLDAESDFLLVSGPWWSPTVPKRTWDTSNIARFDPLDKRIYGRRFEGFGTRRRGRLRLPDMAVLSRCSCATPALVRR